MTTPTSPLVARIICIGSVFDPEDAIGLRVHHWLQQQRLAPGVELIDGGIGGLSLLTHLEGCPRVLFIDAVKGFASPGEWVMLSGAEVEALANPCDGHAAGLPYLLRAARLIDVLPPHVDLLGLEAPSAAESIVRAGAHALSLFALETSPSRYPGDSATPVPEPQ